MDESQRQHETDARKVRWPSAQTLFDLFLVLFTGVLCGTSLLQWCALSDTLRETKKLAIVANIQANAAAESAKAAQDANDLARQAQKKAQDLVADADRPWIGVHRITLVDFAPGKKTGVQLDILNSGKTPGLTILPKISIRIIEGLPSQPPDQTWPISYQSQAILFPNQTMQFPISLPDPLSADKFDHLASGTVSLIVWGTITYTDRFNGPTQVISVLSSIPKNSMQPRPSFVKPAIL
jgi:hypothetical protein